MKYEVMKSPRGAFNLAYGIGEVVDGKHFGDEKKALLEGGYITPHESKKAAKSSEPKKVGDMNVVELKAHAEANAISIVGLTKKDDILAAIVAAGESQ